MTIEEEPLNNEGQAQYEEDGNRATASVISDRITTPEQLLEYLEIDLDVWEVERTVVNKWEIARRNDQKHLEFTQGKIDGVI